MLSSWPCARFLSSSQSKEVGVQLQEDLMKVLNELYTVREIAGGRSASFFKMADRQQRSVKMRHRAWLRSGAD